MTSTLQRPQALPKNLMLQSVPLTAYFWEDSHDQTHSYILTSDGNPIQHTLRVLIDDKRVVINEEDARKDFSYLFDPTIIHDVEVVRRNPENPLGRMRSVEKRPLVRIQDIVEAEKYLGKKNIVVVSSDAEQIYARAVRKDDTTVSALRQHISTLKRDVHSCANEQGLYTPVPRIRSLESVISRTAPLKTALPRALFKSIDERLEAEHMLSELEHQTQRLLTHYQEALQTAAYVEEHLHFRPFADADRAAILALFHAAYDARIFSHKFTAGTKGRSRAALQTVQQRYARAFYAELENALPHHAVGILDGKILCVIHAPHETRTFISTAQEPFAFTGTVAYSANPAAEEAAKLFPTNPHYIDHPLTHVFIRYVTNQGMLPLGVRVEEKDADGIAFFRAQGFRPVTGEDVAEVTHEKKRNIYYIKDATTRESRPSAPAGDHPQASAQASTSYAT